MNRDDIISMAWEAGIRVSNPMDTLSPNNVYAHELHRFADLIAAAEREECAKVCDELAALDNLSNYYKVAANAVRARGEK